MPETNVSRIDKLPLNTLHGLCIYNQREETLTLCWLKPDKTVHTQLKRSTFDRRAGDNLWLNISMLGWLQILQCSKCFRAPQALSTRGRAEKQLREKEKRNRASWGRYLHQRSKVDCNKVSTVAYQALLSTRNVLIFKHRINKDLIHKSTIRKWFSHTDDNYIFYLM